MEIETFKDGAFNADFHKRFEKTTESLTKHARWLKWFGLTYMIFSFFLLIIKGAQFYRILMMNEISHGNNNKTEALQEEFKLIQKDYEDEQKSNLIWQTFVTQSDDQMCVLMGNKDTLVVVHAMNLFVILLFFLQGYYMYKSAAPTLRNVLLVRSGPIENANEVLE